MVTKMCQPSRQFFMAAVEARGHRTLRTTQNICNFLIGKSLNILKQNGHTKLWFKFTDRRLHRIGKFLALVSSLSWSSFTGVLHGKTLPIARIAPASALLVDAGIYDQAMEPGGKLRLTAKLTYRGHQLQKDLLRDITRCGLIPAEGIQGDGKNPVFVGIK